jgi:site-specific recombinase XerD
MCEGQSPVAWGQWVMAVMVAAHTEVVGWSAASGVPWPRVLDAYLDADVDNDNTRDSYERYIRAALAGTQVGVLDDLTGAHLASYRARVMRSQAASSTKAVQIACLRSFLRWARVMGIGVPSDELCRYILRTPPVHSAPLRAVSDAEFAAMLRACRTSMERALLVVLGAAGLRASEACALDVRDFAGDHLVVRMGKGAKPREVPILTDAAEIIRTHVRSAGLSDRARSPVLQWHDGTERLNRSRVSGIVVRLSRSAVPQQRPYTPHCLRHGFAMRCWYVRRDVVAVSKLLGHASIATTQRYLDHLLRDEVRSSVAALPVWQ